jgi:four helix bundle protein
MYLKFHILDLYKNPMSFKFEKLRIWQNAMELGEEINTLTSSFPKKEIYNLSSQIRRAGDSVALNISEGSILQSNAEYRKFLGYSIRSLAEVVTCLHKAKRRNYIDEVDFKKLYSNCYDLMNMMIAFRSKLN